MVRSPLRVVAVVLVALLLGLAALRVVAFTTYRVSGRSMLRALLDGDRILVTAWWLQPVEVGDTLVLDVDGETLVKRVAACPGDRIAMLAGEVLRNGQAIDEDIPPQRNMPVSFPETTMGPDDYFMLGDHRRVSVDSRDFGPVHGDQLVGRVVLRLSADGPAPVPAVESPARALARPR